MQHIGIDVHEKKSQICVRAEGASWPGELPITPEDRRR